MDDEVDIGTKNKMPKVAKVKNKMPAPVQITAEQLLREAKERELELVAPPPKQKISDEAELKDYRMRKRKAFEDGIRKSRTVISNWLKYAAWEESQQELQRARSVYERTLDIDHRNITVWLKYAEMEMKHRQINHARNVWDRAVTILPRANQLWYKYTYMEEMLGNVAGCRQVFERWMEWEPEEQAWHSYINFELRHKELDRSRMIYERFVIVHPVVKNWMKYAKFEEKNQYISSARRIYERAVEYFGDENLDESLMIAFSKFEESQKEHERARVIYKYALDHLPKEKCQEIYRHYTIHEKKFGDRTAIEDVIVSKRKFKYEEDVKQNPFNYDAWFDYLRLMESDNKMDQIREIYERAIASVPPSLEKRHWRRYIYLWINYALYEELEARDIDRTRQVYQACLEMMPHKKFTFAKIWLMFAHFEVRQKNLVQARKILGTAIGKCPKDKLFRGYIELELQLREFDRCRKLYEKFLEFSPENCTTWIKFCELEAILGDLERARAIYELAINQPKLDMPEVLWKSYIDFELEQEEFAKTRGLYQRLLQRTKHVKVWLSYAQFELSVDDGDSVRKSRAVFQQANTAMKEADEKEERLMLLEAWKEFEHDYGDDQTLATVNKLMPNKVKRRRKIQTDTGADAGWEEYYDYIFPDDQAAQPNLKLLAMAKMWKKKQELSDDDDAQPTGNTETDVMTGQTKAISGSSSEEEEEEEADNGEKSGKEGAQIGDDIDKDDSISSTSSDESDAVDSDNDGGVLKKDGVPRSNGEVLGLKKSEDRLSNASEGPASDSDSESSDSESDVSGAEKRNLRDKLPSSSDSDVKPDVTELNRRQPANVKLSESLVSQGRQRSSSSSSSDSSESPTQKRRSSSSSQDEKPDVRQSVLSQENVRPPSDGKPSKRQRSLSHSSSSGSSSSSRSRSPPTRESHLDVGKPQRRSPAGQRVSHRPEEVKKRKSQSPMVDKHPQRKMASSPNRKYSRREERKKSRSPVSRGSRQVEVRRGSRSPIQRPRGERRSPPRQTFSRRRRSRSAERYD